MRRSRASRPTVMPELEGRISVMIFWMVAVSRVLSSVADERFSSMRARGMVAIYGRIWAMEGGVLRTYL